VAYEQIWYSWAAVVAFALALALMVIWRESSVAERILSFVLGAVFGQICILLFVGFPKFLAIAYTEGAGNGVRQMAFALAYALGAVSLGGVGVVCARNPLITVTWWFIAGAVSTNAAAVVRTASSWGQQDPAAALTSVALSLVFGAALATGYWWGLRSRRVRT